MSELGKSIGQLLIAALLSGAVVSTVLSVIFRSYITRIEQEIRSQRTWKEQSIAELLGPVNMQLDRTERAFQRWDEKNLYLEAKVVQESNSKIRDLLLEKGHLIPPELLEDAGKLIEHYDVWLEKFEKQRKSENPDLESAFVFVGPDGYTFPKKSADRFQKIYLEYWRDLYSEK